MLWAHSCVTALLRFCVETKCGQYAKTPWSIGQGTRVFQKIKILKRKRTDTQDALSSAAPTSMGIHGLNIW